MTNEELTAALEALVARAAVLNGTKWRGSWIKAQAYASRDLVLHNGKTYMSLTNQNVNNLPYPRSNKWSEIAVTQVNNTVGGIVSGDVIPTPNGIPQATPDAILNAGWLPPDFSNADVYVSPDGDDDNDGSSWQKAKRTIYEGIKRIRALGGGTVHCANWCEVGGPVPGQGIWLRRDWQVDACVLPGANNNFLPVPGFQELDVPIQIMGHGGSKQVTFGSQPMAQFHGGGSTQFKPAVWIVGSKVGNPFRMVNMAADWGPQFDKGFPSDDRSGVLGCRLWVDFDRKASDVSIVQISVSNATRTGTSTVFTLDMATVPSLTVTRGSRTSNVTRLTIPNPGINFPPWKAGQIIRVVSGDASFASGDYTLTSISDPDQNSLVWTVDYAETGSNVADKAIAGSSLKSHGCQAKELLWLTSSNGSFDTQQYYVTAHTANTVTVYDPMVSGNANQNNIGTIAHQERYYVWSPSVSFENCSHTIQTNRTDATHGWDLGQHLAIPASFKTCWFGGATLPGRPAYDWRAGAAFYAYTGKIGGAGAFLEDCNGNGGGIYLEAVGGSAVLTAKNCLIEQPDIHSTKPGILVHGNDYTSVYIDRFTNADGESGVAWVELVGVPYAGAQVFRSGRVKGTCTGGDMWTEPGCYGPGGGEKNPWTREQVTTWANDGRITGKHPAAVRLFGPVGARFKNVISAAADWIPEMGKATVTPGGGETAPNGMLSDLIETTQAGNIIIKTSGADGATWENGGKFAFCGWINAPGANDLTANIATANSASFSAGSIGVGYCGTGWQFVSGFFVVSGVSSSTPAYTVYTFLPAGVSVSYYGLTAFYIPADIDDNDAYEFIHTLKHQPRYLMPGMVGTMEDQKFIAHGGLGVKTSLVTVAAPGTADRTLIIYDENGDPLIKLHGEAP